MSPFDLLHQMMGGPTDGHRYFGVVCGVVTNNQDPDGLHRVKVRYPWLNLEDESHWARVATPMAGNARGVYFLPEVDDEVLVAFEHGSLEHPYVIGALWNGQDKPPEDNQDGCNDNRSIHSRSGHVIRLSDKSGDERVEIIDKTGNNRVVIHSQDNSIQVEATGDISVKSTSGRVKIEGVGIDIKSSADVQIEAQSTLSARATSQMSLNGAIVDINGS
ncbi:phage baseplate assembly protein V [Ideonella sp. YS5]|uniref:phage baseplate assembly protein V n=1 Tax=Ideonella sp. YS5 TaxID=3453714 RepID=UPI003EEED413